MITKLTRRPSYTIDTPCFKGARFTESSRNYIIGPDAVAFARDTWSVLQNLRAAAAFHMAEEERRLFNYVQATRTTALHFFDKHHVPYVAIDDIRNPHKNLTIANVQACFRSYQKKGHYTLPKNNPLIHAALRRAEHADRVVQAPTFGQLELKTEEVNGTTPFGKHPLVVALLKNLSEPYARFLFDHDFSKAYIWTAKPSLLETTLDHQHVHVCPVFFNADNVFVNGYSQCPLGGIARGHRP